MGNVGVAPHPLYTVKHVDTSSSGGKGGKVKVGLGMEQHTNLLAITLSFSVAGKKLGHIVLPISCIIDDPYQLWWPVLTLYVLSVFLCPIDQVYAPQ